MFSFPLYITQQFMLDGVYWRPHTVGHFVWAHRDCWVNYFCSSLVDCNKTCYVWPISRQMCKMFFFHQTDSFACKKMFAWSSFFLPLWYCIVFRCVSLCGVALRCVVMRCAALRCVVLHCVVWCCVALRCVVLYGFVVRTCVCAYSHTCVLVASVFNHFPWQLLSCLWPCV